MDKVMAQLGGLAARYGEIRESMADPEVIDDTRCYMEISKGEADIREVVQKHRKYQEDQKTVSDNKEIIENESDEDLVEMAKKKIVTQKKELLNLERKLKF